MPPAKGKAVFYWHYLTVLTRALAAPMEPRYSLQLFTSVLGKVSQHHLLPVCVNHHPAYVYSATTLSKIDIIKRWLWGDNLRSVAQTSPSFRIFEVFLWPVLLFDV